MADEEDAAIAALRQEVLDKEAELRNITAESEELNQLLAAQEQYLQGLSLGGAVEAELEAEAEGEGEGEGKGEAEAEEGDFDEAAAREELAGLQAQMQAMQ